MTVSSNAVTTTTEVTLQKGKLFLHISKQLDDALVSFSNSDGLGGQQITVEEFEQFTTACVQILNTIKSSKKHQKTYRDV